MIPRKVTMADAKFLIHVGAEIVVIGGIAFYFQKKVIDLNEKIVVLTEENKKLREQVERLETMALQNNQAIHRLFSMVTSGNPRQESHEEHAPSPPVVAAAPKISPQPGGSKARPPDLTSNNSSKDSPPTPAAKKVSRKKLKAAASIAMNPMTTAANNNAEVNNANIDINNDNGAGNDADIDADIDDELFREMENLRKERDLKKARPAEQPVSEETSFNDNDIASNDIANQQRIPPAIITFAFPAGDVEHHNNRTFVEEMD